MNRRTFLATSGAATITPTLSASAFPHTSPMDTSSYTRPLVKPKVLKPGDTVSVIAPATQVLDPDSLAIAKRVLDFFGLTMKMGKYVGKRVASYQETIKLRVEEMHEAFADTSVSAVFPIRGGYGAQQILDRLDYNLIRKHPKFFIGYSDITALHFAMYRHAGLVTFHGPNIQSAFTPYTQKHYRKALFETSPLGLLTNPEEQTAATPRRQHTLRTISGGKAEGEIIVGNLSLITALMGTPYDLDTKGKILILEDVDEQPYSMDRMLMQMRLAGKLQQCAGIIMGECAGCGPADFKPSFASPYTFGETMDNLLADLNIPVFYGLTMGHIADQLTIPLGVRAVMDADKGTLDIKESAVVA